MDRFEKLRRDSKKTFKILDERIDNLHVIANESRRVADIAANAEGIINDLDRKFAEVTKLNKTDITFLFLAVALQCARQYIIGTLTQRKDHKESAEMAHSIQDKLWGKEKSVNTGVRYRATFEEIIHTYSVPYDVTKGSKKFGLGGEGNKGNARGFLPNGMDHRFRTLGHDPILGWIFGTSNIVTRTLTDWRGLTYHVKAVPDIRGLMHPTIVNNASTLIMLNKVKERMENEPKVLGAAIIKQGLHISSDLYSTAGLQIPIVPKKFSPEFAQTLASYGIDTGNVIKLSAQSGFSVLINMLIAMTHGLFYDDLVHGRWSLYEVRTRKVLSYSNAIASGSNILAVAVSEAIACYTGNSELAKKGLQYLDIGGIIVTLYRLISDYKFISRIKQEFLEREFYKIVIGKEYDF